MALSGLETDLDTTKFFNAGELFWISKSIGPQPWHPIIPSRYVSHQTIRLKPSPTLAPVHPHPHPPELYEKKVTRQNDHGTKRTAISKVMKIIQVSLMQLRNR